ncbi:hypothetical protein M2155_003544 [Streptomyces sp. SAI-119]|uniref:hypothetical protein n=1 Tax=Streptomyces sp. SAI-119 TaxID=2940541 RepID=UPI00247BFA75|nr:hypothetical protein [Streptomyces sp. SAI-119]
MSATKSGGTGTPEHEDAVPESRGEAGGPASQGEGAVPESRGEDAVLESRGEAGVPASQGEGAVPESREEVGVPESQGDGDAGAPASRGRLPRAASALRWIAAVAVLAVAGTATAYGITRLDREDVPGLPAEADGLWEFPPLTAAPLPSDSPAPFADEDDPGVHHADPRALVLPAPEGAVEDRALRGRDGWSATDDFLSEYAEPDRATLGQLLVDTGLRHITARGWTTGDGTRTRVYLLRFGTAAVVDDLFHQHMAPRDAPGHRVRGAERSVPDEDLPDVSGIAEIRRAVYDEPRPYGTEHVRQAYLSAGDVLAVVLQSRAGTVATVPFAQTVALQSRLLA